MNNEVIGITSWGYSCGAPDFPGVYTDVAVFSDWIKKTQEDN